MLKTPTTRDALQLHGVRAALKLQCGHGMHGHTGCANGVALGLKAAGAVDR